MRWVIFALASTLIGQPSHEPSPVCVFSEVWTGARRRQKRAVLAGSFAVLVIEQ
jgi:hypothetical protein